MERLIWPDGGRIREIRKAKGWSQDELAKQAGNVSKRTIENVEKGETRIQESKLKLIAAALGVSSGDLTAAALAKGGEAPEPEAGVEENGAGAVQLFGFGQREVAFRALDDWQMTHSPKRARVICFTLHKLDDLLLDLLGGGVEQVEVFMGVQAMARRLNSRRQGQLLDAWLGEDSADLLRYIPDQLKFRYYDCPPSFTAVALDGSAYLINHYLWFPTLNWLSKRDPAGYAAHWTKYKVDRRPGRDPYTMNGIGMPTILGTKDPAARGGKDFDALRDSFELVWHSCERDESCPAGEGNAVYPRSRKWRNPSASGWRRSGGNRPATALGRSGR